MKFTKTSLFILCFTCFCFSAKAQFWKKMKDKAVKKLEQKVENKIDQETDKVIDSALNKERKKAKIEKTYRFKGKITVEILSEQEDKASFNIFFDEQNKETICMQMSAGEGDNIYNIISPKKAISFINASGMKIKRVLTEGEFSGFDNTDKVPKKEELQKTGNTKTILGYLCYEYQYKNDGGIASAWVTTQNFPIKATYAPMLGMTNKTNIEGFVLELDYKANNGESATVKVIKIDKDKTVFINTSEYKSMGF